MKKIIQYSFILFILFLLGFYLNKDWVQIKDQLANISLDFVIVSYLIGLLIYPEGAFVWYKIIQKADPKLSFLKAMSIWEISNSGRLIPGVIWQYLGRVEMTTKRSNLTRPQVVLSLVYEMYFVLLGGAILGLFVAFGFKDLSNYSILIIMATVLLIFIGVFNAHIISIISKIHRNIGMIFKLNLADSIVAILFVILNFLLNGIVIYLICASLGIVLPVDKILYLTSAFAFSWIIGYLSFFAPGGVGVTDISLVFFLSFLMPSSLSLIVAILFRLILILSEATNFLLALKIYNERH